MRIKLNKLLSGSSSLRYMFDDLNISSSCSSSLLLESSINITNKEIIQSYSQLRKVFNFIFDSPKDEKVISSLRLLLGRLKDIRGTIKRLAEGYTADDIELFEIKNLAIITSKVAEILSTEVKSMLDIPDLKDIILLLDPEKTGTLSFYIYDIYDSKLAELRKKAQNESKYQDELLYQCDLLEEKVRNKLTVIILNSIEKLSKALMSLAKLDVLMAKADQMLRLDLTFPAISDDKTTYCELFNPEIKSILEVNNINYQKTSISFSRGMPLLITGANMGGKSITIKTLQLSQILFQFGFGIPAKDAFIMPVNEVFSSSGDYEDSYKGLSSFAAEIQKINEMISAMREKKVILGLIDEPARTTNPSEGAALTSALISSFYKSDSLLVLTTHYTLDNLNCDRIRVKGFSDGKMDYSLINDTNNEPPEEALRIAESLGADKEWIKEAKIYLTNNKLNK